MTMKPLLLLTLAFTSIQVSIAGQIDSTRLEFFPLHLGDEWQYYIGYYDGNPGYTRTYKVVNADTLLSNGERYFQLNEIQYNSLHVLYRIDSLFRVWETNASPIPDTCFGHISEDNFYRLNEPDSAVWQVCDNRVALAQPPWLCRYGGIYLWDDFGTTRELMAFQAGGYLRSGDSTVQYFGPTSELMRDFGIYYEGDGEVSYIQLIGAVINGVKYGSLSDVGTPSTAMPITFQLFQNFPNPFNGSTTIKYTLPKRSRVLLAIYDILGREVTLLKNDEEVEGVHSVQFANDKLSSGVYYYQLRLYNTADGQSEHFFQTKKLIFLK